MTQKTDGEHIGYVLFSQFNDDVDGKRIIIFVGEFDDVADVEQKKAEFNRTIPNKLKDMVISVGLAHFHPHPDDEDKDFILVTPKDGTEPFFWSQMISIEEIVEYANERGL